MTCKDRGWDVNSTSDNHLLDIQGVLTEVQVDVEGVQKKRPMDFPVLRQCSKWRHSITKRSGNIFDFVIYLVAQWHQVHNRLRVKDPDKMNVHKFYQ